MIKRKFETRERLVTEDVIVDKRLFCDICSKEIENNHEYWRVLTRYGEWVNECWVSHCEDFHVCSMDCLRTKVDEYAKESSEENTELEIHITHNIWEGM